MNYLTNVKNVTKLSQQELSNTSKSSWHDQYKDSAWIYIGGLPFDLTEGDIICIFSQYGEVVNINLIRAKETGKSKGFCFLCYQDQRSTILAVDNFNGIKILNRTIRVDHVQNYKVPKNDKKANEETKRLYAEGCAPKPIVPIMPKTEPLEANVRETLADQIQGDIKLPQRLPIYTNIKGELISDTCTTEKSTKKEKKKKKDKNKRKKKSKKSDCDSHNSSDSEETDKKKSKKNKNHEFERRNRDNEFKREKVKSNDRHEDCSSKYSDKSIREKVRNSDRYEDSSSKYSDKSEKYADNSSKKSKHRKWGSPKRRDRSRSRDDDDRLKKPKRDVSPNIPKRWR